ncbi:hypothetical protein [Comamonas aquatica]|uniref:hypothetical protein n=1 Tax=Comamonas aquatica TaxID=225991 RepID=UPI00244884A4|nr:hypothetical protein [Comamonas aquatica]MDH1674466.1 hypothetical protein [Comamonas aquatica]MDH1677293.1 hypothetical protein [Comamonas aquatica]
MNFKNELERKAFEIAKRVLGSGVDIEHNKTIQIESALFPEVASFKGPPKKEIDVLVAELSRSPRIVLLVSCKLLSRRAEPAHIQEWCSVVQTMNRYSDGTTYLGLVLSPTGFTSGCEAWASSHNLGLIPPLKGRTLDFDENTVLRMFERSLIGLRNRVALVSDDLKTAPSFFDFVFGLVRDYEGHEETTRDQRYFEMPAGWASSFGKMYSSICGKTILDLFAVENAGVMTLSGGMQVRVTNINVIFGEDNSLKQGVIASASCWKNIDMNACTSDFVKSKVIGKAISSAADFGRYLEVGVDSRFNLGIHPNGFHLISTENPLDKHRL